MANVWWTDVTVVSKISKEKSLKMMEELHNLLDPDSYHSSFDETSLFYQTKWSFHSIEYEVLEFSEQYPDVKFHISNDGDVPYAYDNGDAVYEEHHIDYFFQNGQVIERTKISYHQLLKIFTVAELRKIAKKQGISLQSAKKKSDIIDVFVESWTSDDFDFSWDSFTVTQLNAICKKHQVTSSGSKQDKINALIEYLELIFKEEEVDKYSEEYYQVLRERNDEEELRVEASKWLYHHLGRRGSFSADQLPYVENINFDRGSMVINFDDRQSGFFSLFFDRFHPGIYQMKSLKRLSYTENNVFLHEDVGLLQELQTLLILGQGSIPQSIFELSNLEYLGLVQFEWSDKLTKWSNFTKIEILLLIELGLEEVPLEISKCTTLKQLNMRNNQLTELPSELSVLTKLEGFHLANNQLTEIPDWIGKFKNLEHLHVDGNPIDSKKIETFQKKYPHITIHK